MVTASQEMLNPVILFDSGGGFPASCSSLGSKVVDWHALDVTLLSQENHRSFISNQVDIA
jgi:hypothetical protein